MTLVLLALTLTGCPLGGVTQIDQVPETEPLRAPQLINRPGPLEHELTGFTFAEEYDQFQRVTAYRYDTAGLDISVGYNDRRPGCLVIATFYIYPAPRMVFFGASPHAVVSLQERWLADESARSKAEVEAAHPALREASVQSSVLAVSELLVQGPSLRFAEADQLSELHLSLYDRQWFVKSRFTYPRACEHDARARLAALGGQLPWAVEAPAPMGH